MAQLQWRPDPDSFGSTAGMISSAAAGSGVQAIGRVPLIPATFGWSLTGNIAETAGCVTEAAGSVVASHSHQCLLAAPVQPHPLSCKSGSGPNHSADGR